MLSQLLLFFMCVCPNVVKEADFSKNKVVNYFKRTPWWVEREGTCPGHGRVAAEQVDDRQLSSGL